MSVLIVVKQLCGAPSKEYKMIKRKDDTWTTIQCRNCMNCYKVLNDRFQIKQQCPYCHRKIDLNDKHSEPTETIQESMAAAERES